MRTQPKKNITKINKKQVPFGKQVRLGYQKKILDKSAIFPKPLEYDDIDKAVFEFVENLKEDITKIMKRENIYT